MATNISRPRQIEEIIKCGKDPIYFLNAYARIQHPQQGVIPFKTYPFQDDCVRDFVKHRFNIILKSRQLGLSTLSAAYAVWMTLFHKDQNVLIIATKQRVAAAVIKKVKTVLMNLPPWMKISPITTNNKQEVAFKNGSSIKAIPTSEDAGRSESLSLLIIDEAAFIRNFDELWTALYPTLSTGGRAIVLSTPNGVGGQYYELYMGAEQGLNGFNAIKLPWHIHPEHDQAWFDKESKNFSERELAQELMCVSADSLIVTSDGSKPSEQICVGDSVLTHEGRFRKVLKVHGRLLEKEEKLFSAEIFGENHNRILLTGNHPVATLSENGTLTFTPVEKIDEGRKCFTFPTSRVPHENERKLSSVHFTDVTEKIVSSDIRVYNFEVEEDHTYVVDSLVVHNCDFLASGETFLSDGDIRWVGSLVKPPIQRMGPDNNVWIWKGPLSHQKYLISADVSRGDSTDFSGFHVICYSGEVVAEYKGKIRPDRFAELLIQLGTMYNTALICPESNTYGYAVCMKIQESGYSRLYYQGDRNVYIGDYVPKQDLSKAGFTTTGGSRHRILSKLEEVIRNKKLISYSSRFYDELKTFVWLGEKAQAMRNRNDDLLLSMAIGSWILDAAEGYSQDSSLIAEAMLASMGTSRTEFKQPEIRGTGTPTYPVPGPNTDPAVDVFQDGKASERSRFRYGVQVSKPFKWLLD